MSPSNRTADRLASLERDFAAGKLAAEAYSAARKRLEKLGPRWEARWTLPDGKTERTKTFKSKTQAAAYEVEQRALVRRREHQDPQHIRATIGEILDFYLTQRMHRDGKPKASLKNARAHKKNVVAIWGNLTLDALDLHPEKHCAHLRAELRKKFPGGGWNNKVTAAAAVAYWIWKKRLRILNPFDAYDWPAPDNERKHRMSWEGHRKAVQAAHKLRPWLPVFLEMGWETGWRSGEIQDWQADRLHLNPQGEDFPWVLTLVEKQGEANPVYEEKPITWRAAGLLRAYLAGRASGPVWPQKRTATDRWVRKALNNAGLSEYRFHDYRRSIKKRMEDAGIPDALGADYTGHGEDMHDRYKTRARKDYEVVLRRLEPEKN